LLSDLILPDSQGFDTFIKTHAEFPSIPIILQSLYYLENRADNIISGLLDFSRISHARLIESIKKLPGRWLVYLYHCKVRIEAQLQRRP